MSSRESGSILQEANEETFIIVGEVSRRIMAAFLTLIATFYGEKFVEGLTIQKENSLPFIDMLPAPTLSYHWLMM